MTSPTLRSLCRSVTLASALPRSHAVLHWREHQRDVGAHPCCDVRTAMWRDAVIQSAATSSLLPHELLFGLAGAPAVIELHPGPDIDDLGGGVYRHGEVDLFATTLEAHQVLDAVAGCSAPGHARVGVRRDELTGVTLVAVRHLVAPPPGDGSLAWALSMACAVGEVSLTV